jgi:hypothetical protein
MFPTSRIPEDPKEVGALKESRYRESRLCRVLGNPVVYPMVQLLDERGPLSPLAVATRVSRRLQTVSAHVCCVGC